MSSVIKVAVSLKDRKIDDYEFEGDEITFGRDAEADVLIDNAGVSRCHAAIERRDDDVLVVKDLGSANGTYVNDDRVQDERELSEDDVVRIGKFAIEATVGEGTGGSPAPERKDPEPARIVDGTMMLSSEDLDSLLAEARAHQAAQQEEEDEEEAIFGEIGKEEEEEEELVPINAVAPTQRTLYEDIRVALPAIMLGLAVGIVATWLALTR